MAETIPYASPEPRRRRWIWIVIIVVIGGSLFIPDYPVRTHSVWICAICASRRQDMEWLAVLPAKRVMTSSALDTWMSANSISHTHDWRNLSRTGKGFFGGNQRMGHGTAPPIYHIPDELLPLYVKTASADQIHAFVKTMQSATEAEQKQAVYDAGELALQAMDAQRPHVIEGTTRPE